MAIGLGAVLAAARGRHGWACALAALSSVASPVAGAFVALAAAAWWLERPRWWPVALAAGGLGPAVALAVAFPEGGSFPFVASSFWPALAASVAVGLAIPRDARVVRIGIALYAVAIVASFVLATPMGGNVRAPRRALRRAGARRPDLAHATGARSSCWRCRSCTGSGSRPSTTGRARSMTRPCTSATTTGCCASWPPATAARSAWRSPSPTTTGRRAGSRRRCRWPAAGSARSTASATRSSMTVVRLPRSATAAGSTTTRCASSRSPTRPIDYSAAREAQLAARRRPLSARGLARRPLARLRGRRRPPAGRAARRA